MDKTFFLDQHGCAKNQVDGELIITRLEKLGYTKTENPEEAALIVVNSCGFIESAKVESLNSVIDARAQYPEAKILLAGCLAERYADDFAETLPEADAIFGNGDISKIDEVVERLMGRNERPVLTTPQQGISCGERTEFLNFKNSAFVKITEGCNNCCSFCAIPIIRGELRSRSASDIVEEIRDLLARGVFEINLIGQDLAAYGRDGITRGDSGNAGYFVEPTPLAELLRSISALEGNFWIRLLYIHPDHFPFDIIPVLNADNRILPYFDVPFQSGSKDVLKRMNRSGTPETYLNMVNRLRSDLKTLPVIRTTFLCGFPGETDENAAETAEFMKQVQPDWSGCFTYSREEDTAAYNMKKQCRQKDMEKRVDVLQEIQDGITTERLTAHVGKVLDCLMEEVIDDPEQDAGIALGRVWFQAPEVDGATIVQYELGDAEQLKKVQPGQVCQVKILGVSGVDLVAAIL